MKILHSHYRTITHSDAYRITIRRVTNDQPRLSRLVTVPDSMDSGANDSAVVSTTTHSSSADSGNHMPAIRKKERDYEGMFEFKKEEIPVVIRHLVIGNKTNEKVGCMFFHFVF